MLVVGLTGGIGSGKSSVSALLADRGAVVIDADAITHELQQPGTPVFNAMVERFGEGIVAADGTLDRAGVADIVFGDPSALADLNAIVHPAVGDEITRQLSTAGQLPSEGGPDPVVPGGPIVILDVPLLVETGRGGTSVTVVVDAHPADQLRRLVDARGLTSADAQARMARQASRAERLAVADLVIDNTGDLEHLTAEVERVWADLVARAAAAA